MKLSALRPTDLLTVIFFATLLLIGVVVFDDYGIPWDEGTTRHIGIVSAKYIVTTIYPGATEKFPALNNVIDLNEFIDRDYGVIFLTPLAVLESVIFGFNGDLYKVIRFRHLVVFLVFFISIIVFYRLALNRFQHKGFALLACLLLVISPRIFADAFYNNKDIILMAAFIFAAYFFERYHSEKSYRNAMLFGLFSAIAIDVRLVGVIIPLAATAFVLWDLFWNQMKENRANILSSFFVYLISCVTFTILFFPFLWENPPERFLEAFHNMSHFRWDQTNLYLGKKIPAADTPWHYIPVWIFITTPLSYLLFFLTGIILIIRALIKNGLRLYQDVNEKKDLMFLGLCVAPVLSVVLLNSIVYDGWRQFYFIYPFFILVAMTGIYKLWTIYAGSVVVRWAIVALLLVDFTVTASTMIRYHPFQNVYFNLLAGPSQEGRFELDYWGLSYRKGLEYIVSTDKSDSIKVFAYNYPGVQSQFSLVPEQRKRLRFVKDDADYFITEFRHFDNRPPPPPEKLKEVYNVKAGPNKILAVYRFVD